MLLQKYVKLETYVERKWEVRVRDQIEINHSLNWKLKSLYAFSHSSQVPSSFSAGTYIGLNWHLAVSELNYNQGMTDVYNFLLYFGYKDPSADSTDHTSS